MRARERFAAWVVTGPLGHLWSAGVDMALIWARWLVYRALRRINRDAG